MPILRPTGFDSFSEYCRFAWAREFCYLNNLEQVGYNKTGLERLGDVLVYPIVKLTDFSMRNIRNPLMILTITSTAILAVTILFYPEELIRKLAAIIPFSQRLKPWMIKAALYATLQSTILGIGVRTFGRLDPSGALWNLWNRSPRQIIPIALGTQVVRN